MANSLILDWTYENEQRAYPLKELNNFASVGYTLANDVLVDAQFVSAISLTSVTLDQITVAGNSVTVVTSTGGPPLC